MIYLYLFFFFFSSRRRHTRFDCDWSSDVCSSDLIRLRPNGSRSSSTTLRGKKTRSGGRFLMPESILDGVDDIINRALGLKCIGEKHIGRAPHYQHRQSCLKFSKEPMSDLDAKALIND